MIEELNDSFPYNIMTQEFSGKEIKKMYSRLSIHSSRISKAWNQELNSQWLIRDYIAGKLIMVSTIMLSSSMHANKLNLRIADPYLLYYSVFNCARAVVLTCPTIDWNNNDFFTMAHSKIIAHLGGIVSEYDREVGERIKKFIDEAREYREVFSYKFPANGITTHHKDISDIINVCKLLCEISQFQTKILEKAITKNVSEDVGVNPAYFDIGYIYGHKNFQFFDEEDKYRLDKIIRKQKRPYCLYSTFIEGIVEDFFGAWCSNEVNQDSEYIYNPDLEWDIIFPFE